MRPGSPLKLEVPTETWYAVLYPRQEASCLAFLLNCFRKKKKNRLGHQFLNWDFASRCSNGEEKKKRPFVSSALSQEGYKREEICSPKCLEI